MPPLVFTDRLEGEEVVALGLPARRLALAGLGGAMVWAVSQLPLPLPLRLLLVLPISLTVAVLAWGRVQGASAAQWAAAAVGFSVRWAGRRMQPRPSWYASEATTSGGAADWGVQEG